MNHSVFLAGGGAGATRATATAHPRTSAPVATSLCRRRRLQAHSVLRGAPGASHFLEFRHKCCELYHVA